jgi:hypothetical protein
VSAIGLLSGWISTKSQKNLWILVNANKVELNALLTHETKIKVALHISH